MSNKIKVQAQDGTVIEYYDKIIGSGTMKDVYHTTCGKNVVAFYRDPLTPQSFDRLKSITGVYRDKIFNDEFGRFWAELLVWPTKIVEKDGRVGFLCPRFRETFTFEYGSLNGDFLKIKNKDKIGKWFASPKSRSAWLAPEEKGNWLGYLKICLLIARGVRRLHAAGLAHSDLSYKNVLVNPLTGEACIIDLDGLVVPGKYPPDVLGTADFIAPEVVATSLLAKDDPNRRFPDITTDRHALAVLIYQYLLLRHPLRGDKVYDADAIIDERLSMGEKALFIEHQTNLINKVDPSKASKLELPWKDTTKLPYKLTGPYLSELFERAFVKGLHSPKERPTADEWESALVKSIDLIQPCQNSKCEQAWFIFDNKTNPKCPFCNTLYTGLLPVINFYSERAKDSFVSDNHRLMVYTNQSLFPWHTNRFIHPNERLEAKYLDRVGYFVLHKGDWYLVNQNIPNLKDIETNTDYPIGSRVVLKDKQRLLIGTNKGDRLFYIQMVKGA